MGKPDLSQVFEIERVAAFIKDGNYKNISLQFSENYQQDATFVYQSLQSLVNDGVSLYILADTSYGSCCVDMVAAMHVSSDLIVHFGDACLSKSTLTIPCLYIFCQLQLDDYENMYGYFSELVESNPEIPTLIYGNVQYTLESERLFNDLQKAYPASIFSFAQVMDFQDASRLSEWDRFTGLDEASDTIKYKLSYLLERPCKILIDKNIDDYRVFYVGPECRLLTSLVMSHHQPIYSFINNQGREESVSVNKMLMKRCLAIEKALSAEIIGILIGTLGVHQYLDVLRELTAMIKAAGKRYFIISVGKLNPAKLANFLELDVFVLIACYQNSFLDYQISKDYLKPILTPFELFWSFGKKSSTEIIGEWSSDFKVFLDKSKLCASDVLAEKEETEEEDVPRYSFATGQYVTTKHMQEDESKDTLFLSYESSQSAFHRFQQRTFKGLEQNSEETLSSKPIVHGNKGIAKNYQNEQNLNC